MCVREAETVGLKYYEIWNCLNGVGRGCNFELLHEDGEERWICSPRNAAILEQGSYCRHWPSMSGLELLIEWMPHLRGTRRDGGIFF